MKIIFKQQCKKIDNNETNYFLVNNWKITCRSINNELKKLTTMYLKFRLSDRYCCEWKARQQCGFVCGRCHAWTCWNGAVGAWLTRFSFFRLRCGGQMNSSIRRRGKKTPRMPAHLPRLITAFLSTRENTKTFLSHRDTWRNLFSHLHQLIATGLLFTWTHKL